MTLKSLPWRYRIGARMGWIRLGGDVSDEEHQAAIEVDLALERFLSEMERLGYWKLCIPIRAKYAVSITRMPLPREPKTLRQRIVAGLYWLIDWLSPYTALPDAGGRTENSCTR